MSLKAAFWLDPIRDMYEAFTIYTFLQLLINFIGGERSLIVMMHGRQPVSHPWPLSLYCSKVDISDPHTFLAIKRGILQYAWLKPILTLAIIIMKATDIYQEGYLGLSSGYLWSGIIYNVSVSVSLYSLAMFWVCMSHDLQPFRPVPKFLCIKLIIFASYWQGFSLSILQFLGAIPNDVPGYTPDNLAAAIQDALICFEMPIFAVSHWYAFSWHDYADATISAARMPVKYALRDAFGIRDLIEDSKETFKGNTYDYRVFDSGDNVLAHEESESRVARMMDGMRYERGGKGKYWIPKPHQVNSRTPLLSGARTSNGEPRARSSSQAIDYRAASPDAEVAIDAEDERLYTSARALEFGDWNVSHPRILGCQLEADNPKYPVITVHQAAKDRWRSHDPNLLTTSTNRNLFQPTKDHEKRRRSEIKEEIRKGKRASSSKSKERPSAIAAKLTRETSASGSSRSGRSQLVDLVVEDTDAEEAERVRARKEGSSAWNRDEQKHFVRTYGDEDVGEEIREGFEPAAVKAADEVPVFAVGEDADDTAEAERSTAQAPQAPLGEEQNPWQSPGRPTQR
jgi:hypothetical protein